MGAAFVCHGGLGRRPAPRRGASQPGGDDDGGGELPLSRLGDLADLRAVSRGHVDEVDSQITADVLWSDPSSEVLTHGRARWRLPSC